MLQLIPNKKNRRLLKIHKASGEVTEKHKRSLIKV